MKTRHPVRAADLSPNSIFQPVSAPVGSANYEDELRGQIDDLIRQLSAWRETAAERFSGLTPRQRQIMRLIFDGRPNKIVAADLGISQRTVENHRARIMKKTGAKSLIALARLALVAAGKSAPDQPNSERPEITH